MPTLPKPPIPAMFAAMTLGATVLGATVLGATVLGACGAAASSRPPATTASTTTAGSAATTATTTAATGAAVARAYASYTASVRAQRLGTPATLAQAGPLMTTTCRLLGLYKPDAVLRGLAQVGTGATLNTAVQDVVLASAAATYICPSHLAALNGYLARAGR